MPPGPGQAPIVPAGDRDAAERLLAVLAPQSWPVRPDDLPAGTALVGGAVRDALLGRLAPRPDLDLVVEGDALAVARGLASRRGGSVVVLDRERSIARLVVKGWTIDLARRMGSWPEEDLLRRDFSVNAIALELPLADRPPALVDPSGGLADLAAGRLRAVAEHNLLDDPLRLLRGVRLATELGFRIEPITWEWVRRHHRRLGEVAGERVLAELERLARAPAGGEGLALLLEADLLAAWGVEVQNQPGELPGRLGSLDAAAATARGLSDAESAWAVPLARLALLLDPAALQRLKASRRMQHDISRLRRWWQRLEGGTLTPEALEERERLALQRELEAILPALLLLSPPGWASDAIERWRDPEDPLFHPRSPLDGATLQAALDLPPGPRLGALLDHLSRERAFGRLPASPAADDPQTLTAARAWLSDPAEGRHG